MSLRQLKLLTVALPTLLIGGFEYARHDLFEHYLSMETGNLYITLLTLLLAYLFASWVFRRIEHINRRLAEEQAKRAVYEERERLARELHDTIAQTLFFVGVMLKQGKVEEARSAVTEIDHHVRQAIFNLRTPPEQKAGFEARLRAWLADWSALSGIGVETAVDTEEGLLQRDEELQLFAIVQEAFTNIRKHSQAAAAGLALRADADGWTLEIFDDGVGLAGPLEGGGPDRHGAETGVAGGGPIANSGTAAAGRRRYGLELMRKRAQELGASFELSPLSADGKGTKLTMRKVNGG
jgi:signal transduction histidine kinase